MNSETNEFESDDWIFSSEAFAEGDEYLACIGYFEKKMVDVATNKNKYKINSRVIKHPDTNPNRKTILFSHGHDTTCNWVTWIKSAVFLFNCDFDIVLFDLPGFGKSTVNDKLKVHFKNWLEDGPLMLKNYLKALGIGKVSCSGFCGGGALMIRTISNFPEMFEKNHIFYNLMISAYPDNFEKIITNYKMNIKVFWNADIDHPIYSVGYKYASNMNKKNNPYMKLIKTTNDDLISSGLWAKGYGRGNSDFIFIFLPSFKFLNFQNSFFYENVNDY